jgi:hypothetical protein
MYEHQQDNEHIIKILEILQYAAANEKLRREMEEMWWREQDEREYERLKEEIAEKEQEIVEKEQELVESRKVIADKDQALVESNKVIADKDQALANQAKEIENLKKMLNIS